MPASPSRSRTSEGLRLWHYAASSLALRSGSQNRCRSTWLAGQRPTASSEYKTKCCGRNATKTSCVWCKLDMGKTQVLRGIHLGVPLYLLPPAWHGMAWCSMASVVAIISRECSTTVLIMQLTTPACKSWHRAAAVTTTMPCPAKCQKCNRGSCVGASKQRTAPCAPQQRGVKTEGRDSSRKQHKLSKLNAKAAMPCYYNLTLPLPLCCSSSSFCPTLSLSLSLSLSPCLCLSLSILLSCR